MASIQKTDKGWRVQIKKKGVRDSRLFTKKRDAITWANERELEITDQAEKTPGELHSLRDAFDLYAKEVSPKKKGGKNEIKRLAFFSKLLPKIDEPIADITPQDIADYRDFRLASVKRSTVNRDLNLISAVFSIAIDEWGWIKQNPCRSIKRPGGTPHRERVIHWHEIRAMLSVLRYSRLKPELQIQATAICFLLALSTGMRAGELCSMEWKNVHEDYVRLPDTKNGTIRNVPLSRKAKRYIDLMRGWHPVFVFNTNADDMGSLFRKYRKKVGLSGFTFHDSRHTAATMLAKKVDVLTLCKIMGWKNTNQALTYYNPSPESISKMLG